MGHVSNWVLANTIFPVVLWLRWLMVSLGSSRVMARLEGLDGEMMHERCCCGGWMWLQFVNPPTWILLKVTYHPSPTRTTPTRDLHSWRGWHIPNTNMVSWSAKKIHWRLETQTNEAACLPSTHQTLWQLQNTSMILKIARKQADSEDNSRSVSFRQTLLPNQSR